MAAISLRRLSTAQAQILCQMADGATLKAHRQLNGSKEHRLHPVTGPYQVIPSDLVEGLKRRGLIQSNMKFPAATYWLSEKGRQVTACTDG